MFNDPLPIVMRGIFIYGEAVECDIRIVRSEVRFGSGDFDDPPEFQDDVAAETFYVEYGSTTERGVFNSTSAGFPSLAEAVSAAESSFRVQWSHEA